MARFVYDNVNSDILSACTSIQDSALLKNQQNLSYGFFVTFCKQDTVFLSKSSFGSVNFVFIVFLNQQFKSPVILLR